MVTGTWGKHSWVASYLMRRGFVSGHVGLERDLRAFDGDQGKWYTSWRAVINSAGNLEYYSSLKKQGVSCAQKKKTLYIKMEYLSMRHCISGAMTKIWRDPFKSIVFSHCYGQSQNALASTRDICRSVAIIPFKSPRFFFKISPCDKANFFSDWLRSMPRGFASFHVLYGN